MTSNQEYILITGAAGFIGMHITSKFLKEGHNVVGVDNENDYYDVNLKKARVLQLFSIKNTSFEYIKGDINDIETWQKISQYNINMVIHLAAQAGVRYSLKNPQAYIDSNILGFQKVLDFLNTKNIKKFFFASSSSVYGKTETVPFRESAQCDKPESYYAATKIANEAMAYSYYKTHGIISIGLRFFTVYGPWGRPDMAPFIFVKSAIEGKEIKVFNHGKQKRDFTYVDDITESIYLLFKKRDNIISPTILNIGKGSPTELERFMEIIESATMQPLLKNYVDAQKGDVALTYSDTTKLTELICYKPKTTIETGIKEFVMWYREYYNKK